MPDQNPPATRSHPDLDAQDELDEALDASFPASDPPAMTAPSVATAPCISHPQDSGQLVTVFRVMHEADMAGPLDPRRNCDGGRWTSPGVPAVYASLTPACAVLEFAAHLDGEKPTGMVLASFTLPESAIEIAQGLPPAWRDYPYRDDVRRFGDAWVASGRSLALRVPSVLCEAACNVIINPAHPDLSRTGLAKAEPFVIDHRLA